MTLKANSRKNKDFYGTEIRAKDDNAFYQFAQTVAHGAKAFVPFSVRGIQKESERGGNALSMAAPLVGIMPAPSDLNKSPAEKLLSEYAAGRMPQGARTAAEADKAKVRQEIYGLLRSGKQTEAMTAFRGAKAEGIMTTEDLHRTQTSAQHSPVYNSFNRIDSLDKLEKVWGMTTDKEKTELQQVYNRKKIKLKHAPVNNQA